MPDEPYWLSADDLIETNREQTEQTGGLFGVRDRKLLESACAKPINHWHYGEGDVLVLAAALLLGVVRNHPFLDGNKRTGVVAAVTFLVVNGYDLRMPNTTLLGQWVEGVIEGRITEEDFIIAVRPYVVPLD